MPTNDPDPDCPVCEDDGFVRVVDVYHEHTLAPNPEGEPPPGYQIPCPRCPRGRGMRVLEEQTEALA